MADLDALPLALQSFPSSSRLTLDELAPAPAPAPSTSQTPEIQLTLLRESPSPSPTATAVSASASAPPAADGGLLSPHPSPGSPRRRELSAPRHAPHRNADRRPGTIRADRPTLSPPLRALLERLPSRTRDAPYRAVDPFRSAAPAHDHDHADGEHDAMCACACSCGGRMARVRALLCDALPRQAYLAAQLRLPALYFARVARIFEDAALSRGEMQRAADGDGADDGDGARGGPALARFRGAWEAFVDTLVREWKTLNVVSALLLSCVVPLSVGVWVCGLTWSGGRCWRCCSCPRRRATRSRAARRSGRCSGRW
ncbi:hypothetical protein BC834DRAFT_495904 [Gloeopeniophorella convolvens]|nr:hypothetical protein BC834DRAFT_495904 [Gloeopeniophorella convolvens]